MKESIPDLLKAIKHKKKSETKEKSDRRSSVSERLASYANPKLRILPYLLRCLLLARIECSIVISYCMTELYFLRIPATYETVKLIDADFLSLWKCCTLFYMEIHRLFNLQKYTLLAIYLMPQIKTV